MAIMRIVRPAYDAEPLKHLLFIRSRKKPAYIELFTIKRQLRQLYFFMPFAYDNLLHFIISKYKILLKHICLCASETTATYNSKRKGQLMKVFLLDTDSLQQQIIETKGGLDEWRRLLKCDLIDIVSYSLEGHTYDIIINDEGLMQERAKPTALSQDLLCVV